jgi:hypothetical protein
MRDVLRLSVVLLAVILGAASAQPQQGGYQGQQPQGGYYGQQPQGNCDGVCRHYLACKGSQDPNLYGQCHQGCVQYNATPEQMAQYEASDCQSAIAVMEGGGQPQGGQGGAECDGCVWDGSMCVWVSQNTYGQAAAMSGGVQECAAHCCGR